MKKLKSKRCILIVEDDDSFRTFLAHYFKRHGYSPVLAESPEEALHLLKVAEVQVDLACFDIDYGYKSCLNGFDLVRIIREELNREIPFFIISTNDEAANKTKSKELGALAFIGKTDQNYDRFIALAEKYFEGI